MKSKRKDNSVRKLGRLRLVQKEECFTALGLQNNSHENTSYVKDIISATHKQKVNRYCTYAEFIHSYVEHINSRNKSSQRVMNLYKTN